MNAAEPKTIAAQCPNCQAEVPAGSFCGLCGAALADGAGHWLRVGTFAACPSESMLRPAIASSLFPHLPQRSRLPFRLGLGLMLGALAVFGTVRITSVVVGIASVGLPLLFALYLRASEVGRDLPRRGLLIAALVGAGLGFGWGWAAARASGTVYGLPLGMPADRTAAVATGLAVAVGGALLTALPVVASRLGTARVAGRESLDGFAIGVLGAMAFTAGATITRLAMQFRTGFIPHSRPRLNVIVEAGLCGVAIPLIAAATGGAVGVALWFTPRDGRRAERRRLWIIAASVLGLYLVTGAANAVAVPQIAALAVHLLIAVVAMLLLRAAVQIALLGETPDPITLQPLLCEHCEHVVPDAQFCPACGAATRASSKASRRQRRRDRPVPVGAS